MFDGTSAMIDIETNLEFIDFGMHDDLRCVVVIVVSDAKKNEKKI